MSGQQVDVLAVLDGNVRAAQNRCDTARSMKGADARLAELREQQAARAAVADLIEAAKMARYSGCVNYLIPALVRLGVAHPSDAAEYAASARAKGGEA